jgi:heme exporter protein D
MQEFFHMGGYAFYIWTSYGLALIILLLNVIVPIKQEKHILQNLARKFKRNQHDNTQQNP